MCEMATDLEGFDAGLASYVSELRLRGEPASISAETVREREKLFPAFMGEVPDGISATDISIPTTAGPRSATLYRPDNDLGNTLIIYVHGGGWVFGSVEMVAAVARQLSFEGQASVLSISYRKAPEHPFPAAHDDVEDQVRWILQAADLEGVSQRSVVLLGDSVGANLAVSAAASVTGTKAKGHARLSGLVLLYPVAAPPRSFPSYQDLGTGFGLSTSTMDFFWASYVPDPSMRQSPRVCPLLRELSHLPPVMVITAEMDPLRDEGAALAARLAEAGVTVAYEVLPRQIHGMLWLGGVTAQARHLIGRAARFTGKPQESRL